MRRYLKRRIAGVLLPAVLIVMSGTGVMAEPITTVDLGTFYAVAENRDPGVGRDPGNNDPGNGAFPFLRGKLSSGSFFGH